MKSITIENPKCEIDDSSHTISSRSTIYGYEGSTAQAYAEKYERKFVDIEKMYDSIETGDINGDGMIDSSDASLVLAEYAKIQTGEDETFTKEQNIAADVNKDGVIDSSDASKILSYYAMVSTGKEPSWDWYKFKNLLYYFGGAGDFFVGFRDAIKFFLKKFLEPPWQIVYMCV